MSSTSYKMDAVPAKFLAGNALDLSNASYQAPAGMTAMLDYSTRAPKKPAKIHHQLAAKLAANHYNKPVVIITSAYSLDKRDFVVTGVYRCEA